MKFRILSGPAEAGRSGTEDGDIIFSGRLWNSRSHGRYPCVSDFEAARLGGGKESSGRGEGAGKGFAGGTLEPD